MHKAALFCSLLALSCAGCTSRVLARNTVTQANTITDIHYRQVLTNLVSYEGNPDVLPHFSVVGTGGTLVVDSGNGNLGFAWDDRTFLGTTLGFGAERTFEDGWTLAPVVDPDKLRAIRAAYQLVTRGEAYDPVGYELLLGYLGDGYMDLLEPGWYCVGRKCDVPKNACYVAHCGKRYIWVTGDGLEGLSRLTLAVLNVATLKSGGGGTAAVAEVPGQHEVTKYFYTPDGQIDRVETYMEPEIVTPIETLPTPQPRENYYNPLQSQIQMGGGPR